MELLSKQIHLKLQDILTLDIFHVDEVDNQKY